MKWLIKHIVLPLKILLTSLLEKLVNNHLFQAFISIFSWKLLSTETANQILANVMMAFAVFAFTLYILEKVFGLQTPLLKYAIFLKPFRNSSLLENPQVLEENISKTVKGSKVVFKFYKKGMLSMNEKLLKVLKWIAINKVTLIGFVSLIVYGLDNYYSWSDQLGMPEEVYYTAIGLIFAILTWAIKGRGFEPIDLVNNVELLYKEFNNNKKIAKAETKKAKEKLKNASLIEALKNEIREEVKKELQTNQPEQPIQVNRIQQK